MCLTLLLIGCTNTNKETQNPISIILNAKHPVSSGVNDSKSVQTQLFDNDGNLYITYWDVSDTEISGFNDATKTCKESLEEFRIFSNIQSIHELDASKIRPSLYVKYVSCVYKSGYKLVDKEAFSPEYYTLSFFRTHSTNSNYIPVGSMYNIKKDGARYISVYNAVINCDSLIQKQGGGVEELTSGDFISVSIEKYIDDFESCLESKGFEPTKISRGKRT